MQPSSGGFERANCLPAALPSMLLAAIAVAAAWESIRLGFGSFSRPGSGLFPFCLSVLLAFSSVITAVRSWSRDVAVKSSSAGRSLRVFLALCLYCILLIPLGFIPATLIFLSLEVRFIERVPWRVAAMRAAIVTAVGYGLFILLGVHLPAGMWLD